MEATVTITIPSSWIDDLTPSQEELREALQLGLNQLRQRQVNRDQVVKAMLRTGRIRHWETIPDKLSPTGPRQPPPVLEGLPTSEIIIAQRKGEL